MILNVMSNSIWISYSFKIQSLEIALVNVICKYFSTLINIQQHYAYILAMLINIILLAIYMTMKPEQNLII